jgi:hypothetical protein
MPTDSWPVAAMVASVALATAAYYISTAWFAHRERMAKLQLGLDPDNHQHKNSAT